MQIIRVRLKAGEMTDTTSFGPFLEEGEMRASEFAKLLKASCEEMVGRRGVSVGTFVTTGSGDLLKQKVMSPRDYMDVLSRFVRKCEEAGIIKRI